MIQDVAPSTIVWLQCDIQIAMGTVEFCPCLALDESLNFNQPFSQSEQTSFKTGLSDGMCTPRISVMWSMVQLYYCYGPYYQNGCTLSPIDCHSHDH